MTKFDHIGNCTNCSAGAITLNELRSNMWRLIDDVRDLNCDVIARNPEAAKRCLSLRCWEVVCFDHDLGTAESGYDVLAWAIHNGHLPDKVQLVTSNPVGQANMANALKADGFQTVDGRNFERY